MTHYMSQAILCEEVVRTLYNEGSDPDTIGLEYPMEAKALASYVKTHKINIRKLNVIEVIHILWPPFGYKESEVNWDEVERIEGAADALVKNHPPRFTIRELEETKNSVDVVSRAISQLHVRDMMANLVVYNVTFPDDSRGMVIVENGLGVEFLAA